MVHKSEPQSMFLMDLFEPYCPPIPSCCMFLRFAAVLIIASNEKSTGESDRFSTSHRHCRGYSAKCRMLLAASDTTPSSCKQVIPKRPVEARLEPASHLEASNKSGIQCAGYEKERAKKSSESRAQCAPEARC